MNLILFDADEIDGQGRATLSATDRRAVHLREVLHVEVGQALRVGVVDGAMGSGVVVRAAGGFELSCRLDTWPSPATDILLLAIPRPKVLLRCIETATALGFGRILLVRTWRTDRSHVEASALATATLAQHARLGLEQAQRTRLPSISVFDRFRPFVEDHAATLCNGAARVAATPQAPRSLASLALATGQSVALAIGPERGFTEFELEALQKISFELRSAGPHPLRVETALAFLAGHVAAIRGES
jgi:16S rRNA (uracil1498-N3)-methyltransferase